MEPWASDTRTRTTAPNRRKTALDRALTALSVDPTMGQEALGSDLQLWRYDDEIEDVTAVYQPSLSGL